MLRLGSAIVEKREGERKFWHKDRHLERLANFVDKVLDL